MWSLQIRPITALSYHLYRDQYLTEIKTRRNSKPGSYNY
jgi:hypothetical protein